MSGVLWSCPEHGRFFSPDGTECCSAAWPVDLSDPRDPNGFTGVPLITECRVYRPRPSITFSYTRIFWVLAGLWLVILGVVGYLYFTEVP